MASKDDGAPGAKLPPQPPPHGTNFYRHQWIMLGCMLGLVGAVGLFYLWNQRLTIESHERERLQGQARVVEKNLGAELSAANAALQGVLKDFTLPLPAARVPAANHRLTVLCDAMTGIRTMFILDAGGIIVSSNREELLGRDLSYREYFKVPRSRLDPALLYVSPPFKTVLGSYLINLTRVIQGPKGEFNGVVSAAIDPEFFSILLSSVLYAPDMRSGIIHQNGMKILTVPERTGLSGKDLSNPASFFYRHRASGRAESVESGLSFATGDLRLTTLRTINPTALSLDQPLTVTVSREVAAMYAAWRRSALAEAALFVLLATAAILGLFLYQRKQRIFDREHEGARSALEDGARRYQSLLKSATDGIHILDRQGKVVEGSQAFLNMLGYTEEEARDLHVWDWDIQWHRGELLTLIERLIAVPETFETRQRRRDGRIIDVEISAHGVTLGGVDYLYAASRDITGRKQAEQELSDSRQRMTDIVDFLPDATFVVDLEGKVIAWNKAMEQMSGVAKEQMIGHGDYAYTIPFYGERRPQLLDLLDITDAEIEANYRHIERRGNALLAETFVPSVYGGRGAHVWAIGAPLYDAKGKRSGAIESIRDITERKRAEIELQEAKEVAEASTRSKSQFLANMSHEIRTPMNAILGLTRLTLETELTERQRDYLFKVQSSSRALLNLLNDILDYSKIEAGRLELECIDFDLDDVLHTLSDLFSYAAEEKGVEIFYEIAPGVPNGLKGDPLRLGQILANLIGNAVKFTSRGEIHVKAEALESPGGEVVLCFSVRDTGIGIEKDQCEALFHAFSQVDSSISRRYGGTGLGLTINKHLVQLMGGEISVASELGVGSVFSFSVRLGISTAVQPARDPENLRGMRALVVDDQETSRVILQRIMESWSFLVSTCASGAEAIGLILQASQERRPFELVLLDWKMPGIDGLEVARMVQDELAQGGGQGSPTVIMVSAYGREQLLECAGETHLDDILIKPVTSSNLFDSVIGIQSRKARRSPHRATEAGLEQDARLARIRGARILLVEDNEINQLVALESLRKMGFEVEVAANGREAVELAAANSYRAILMDLQMPEMDGFQATALIRATATGRDLPIIALTAAAMVQEKKACLDAGMNDHVPKPIDPAELAQTLITWIAPLDGEPGGGCRGRGPHGVLRQEPRLPDALPGFELEPALGRLHGNRGMLASLLLRFADDIEAQLASWRGMMEAGESEGAARALHGIRGVAGNLGAVRLAAATERLERELPVGDGSARPAFEEALLAAVLAVRGAVVREETAAVPAGGLDLVAAGELLCRLRELAGSYSLVPEELLQGVSTLLGGHVAGRKLDELSGRFLCFAYDEAQLLLEEIASDLGIGLKP